MKWFLCALGLMFICVGCDTPYTGFLKAGDIDKYVEQTGEETVCLADGFDTICIRTIPGPPGKDGKDGESIIGPRGAQGPQGEPGRDGRDGVSTEVVVVIHLHIKPEVEIQTEPIAGGVRVYADRPLTELDLSPEASDDSEVTVTPVSDGAILTVDPPHTETSEPSGTENVPTQQPPPPPLEVDENPKKIRVEGGNSDDLQGPIELTIRTGEHDEFSCESNHLQTTAYQDGVVRQHQHWDACQVGDDVVVFLKDHPALTCGVGPNRHELQIEGVDERVIVEEDCQ